MLSGRYRGDNSRGCVEERAASVSSFLIRIIARIMVGVKGNSIIASYFGGMHILLR